MTQGIEKQIRGIPAIEAKFHLFQIGREMLCADSVPRSCDSAFQEREGGFDGVSVNVSHDVNTGTVIDFLVLGRPLGFTHRGFVRGCIVSEDYFHVLRDVLADILRECSTLCISSMEEAEIAIALTDADNNFLVVKFPYLAFSTIPAAHISNVYLDFAVQHRLICLSHRVPDAVAQIPRCFVSADSERALNLAGRHTLFGFAEEKGCSKPRCERQVRIVENAPSGDGELVVTVFAVEQMLFGFQFDHGAFAAQAARAFREAQARQKLAALGISREERVYVH